MVNHGTGRNNVFGLTPDQFAALIEYNRLDDLMIQQRRSEMDGKPSCIERLLVAVVKKYPAYTDHQINMYVKEKLLDAYDELAVSLALRRARGLLAAQAP
jgi:septum formation topological specificity factor MinE